MNASTIGSKEIISIAFEEGVEEIGEAAFYKCDDLTNKLFLRFSFLILNVSLYSCLSREILVFT